MDRDHEGNIFGYTVLAFLFVSHRPLQSWFLEKKHRLRDLRSLMCPFIYEGWRELAVVLEGLNGPLFEGASLKHASLKIVPLLALPSAKQGSVLSSLRIQF